jgi:class 3 adenylate cyclase
MIPESPDASARRVVADDDRGTRLYLVIRRHAILAPIQTIGEICGLLGDDQRLQSCEPIMGDMLRVQTTAVRMLKMIDTSLRPDQIDEEATAKCLNHDLRGLLTIVIGYGDEMRRKASRYELDDFHEEFNAIGELGREALNLIDETVKALRSVAKAPRDETADDDAIGAGIEPGRILVAEDDESICHLLCEYLRAQGHTIVSARGGTEAIERLKAEPFDLVLTDLVMPGGDGFDVLRFLKANVQFNAIPAIVISGHGALEDIARSIAMGAVDYLPKPFNRTILRARVGASLEKKRLRDRVEQQRQRNDDLLRSILPGPVADELILTDTVIPRRTENVAVLFADIVNFTAYCDQLRAEPERVLEHLRRMFESWEIMAQECGVEKIKTIGDAFMAAAGLLNSVPNPVLSCVRLGLRMIDFTRSLTDEQGKLLGFDLRVGIHIGPVVSGLLGRRQSLFDLWGDTVNLASRVESHGNPGCVNLSAEAWKQIKGLVRGETREFMTIKGKPEPVEIIHLDPSTFESSGLRSGVPAIS